MHRRRWIDATFILIVVALAGQWVASYAPTPEYLRGTWHDAEFDFDITFGENGLGAMGPRPFTYTAESLDGGILLTLNVHKRNPETALVSFTTSDQMEVAWSTDGSDRAPSSFQEGDVRVYRRLQKTVPLPEPPQSFEVTIPEGGCVFAQIVEHGPEAKVRKFLERRFPAVDLHPVPHINGFRPVGAKDDLIKIKRLLPLIDREGGPWSPPRPGGC